MSIMELISVPLVKIFTERDIRDSAELVLAAVKSERSKEETNETDGSVLGFVV